MNSLKPRILCNDDELMNLSLLEAMLVPRGFEVVTAPEASLILTWLRLISRFWSMTGYL